MKYQICISKPNEKNVSVLEVESDAIISIIEDEVILDGWHHRKVIYTNHPIKKEEC